MKYLITVVAMVLSCCGGSSPEVFDLDVSGVYVVTEGTVSVTDGEQSLDQDMAGGILTVSQNGTAVQVMNCLAEVNADGVADCNGSVFYTYGVFGMIENHASGSIYFRDDGTFGTLDFVLEMIFVDVDNCTMTAKYKVEASLQEVLPEGN